MAAVRLLGLYTLAAALLLTTTGCGDSHEAITVDTIRVLDEYAQRRIVISVMEIFTL